MNETQQIRQKLKEELYSLPFIQMIEGERWYPTKLDLQEAMMLEYEIQELDNATQKEEKCQ